LNFQLPSISKAGISDLFRKKNTGRKSEDRPRKKLPNVPLDYFDIRLFFDSCAEVREYVLENAVYWIWRPDIDG
jgi:hypothetical protein